MISFETKSFEQLTNMELFELYKLRTRVFVVEQDCAYQEVDDDDLIATHLLGKDDDGKLVAYARLIPGESVNDLHLGRVVVDPAHRKDGLGRQLVTAAMAVTTHKFKHVTVLFAQAQAYLENFYKSFGFQSDSKPYLLDNIPHMDMSIPVERMETYLDK